MSSTRRASADAPLAQGRYMSAPEYSALRGLCGSAVAAKASILSDPRDRSLILFLDALSRRPGGLKKVAADFLAAFPERIGTPSMHKFGVKAGKTYTAEQVRVVRDEVESDGSLEQFFNEALSRAAHREDGLSDSDTYHGQFPLKGEMSERNKAPLTHSDWLYHVNRGSHNGKEGYALYVREEEAKARNATERAQKHPSSYPAAVFVEACRKKLASTLEDCLIKICIDPSVALVSSVLFHFHNLIEALLEFKARHEQAAAAQIAPTEITSSVARTLSRGLRSQRIVVANGVEGVGKSFGAQNWCEQHLGEARFIPLKGIVNKTTLFQSISRACGLAAGDQQKSQQMQTRVESYLERSGIMLVIDEAHRLFSQTERMTAHPELMNWVYTLWDMGIPVALLVTPQFIRLMDHAEQQTGWNSGQFKRRVEKWDELPKRISEESLRAVACKLAPRYTKGMIDELVDFALPARRQLDSLKRAISAAEEFATEAGREIPNARDLDSGIKDAQATDLALTTPLDRERRQTGTSAAGRPRRRRAAAAATPQLHGDPDAEPLPLDTTDPDFADRESAPLPETPVASPRGARPVSVAV